MNNVLQINVSVPLDSKNFPDERLYNYIWKVLDPEGLFKTQEQRMSLMVPISVICYSRKVVGQSTEKLLELDNFADDESLVTGKDGSTKYNISLLRKTLKKCFTDEQSSRNVQAMYETSSYINHEVQQDLVSSFNSHRTNLHEHLFENSAHHDRTNFNIYYLKNGYKAKNDWANLFADRKEDYDEFVTSIECIPEKNIFIDSCFVREFRNLVDRWYPILESYVGQRGTAIPYDKIQSDRRYNRDRDLHKYYPRPSIPAEEKDTMTKSMMLTKLKEMKDFFYNVEIFMSIADGSKKALLALDLNESGTHICMDEEDEYSYSTAFDIDAWYKYCQHDLFEKRVDKLRASVIDAEETFQGPRLQYPAGWQKMVRLQLIFHFPVFKPCNDG